MRWRQPGELASQAIERTCENLGGLREGLKDASADAQRKWDRYAKQTSRHVSKRPVTSALIVGAVGAKEVDKAGEKLGEQVERAGEKMQDAARRDKK